MHTCDICVWKASDIQVFFKYSTCAEDVHIVHVHDCSCIDNECLLSVLRSPPRSCPESTPHCFPLADWRRGGGRGERRRKRRKEEEEEKGGGGGGEGGGGEGGGGGGGEGGGDTWSDTSIVELPQAATSDTVQTAPWSYIICTCTHVCIHVHVHALTSTVIFPGTVFLVSSSAAMLPLTLAPTHTHTH